MHLKAVFPLLVLSCFFLASNCFIQIGSYEVQGFIPSGAPALVSINIGSYSLFINVAGSIGLNVNNGSTIDLPPAGYPTYATIGDVAYISSTNWIGPKFFAFNGTSGTTRELTYGPDSIGHRSFTSLGKYLFIAGGESTEVLNTVGIYDTTTDSFSTVEMPFARSNLVSTAVGDYVLFAGGYNSGWKSDVAIFNINTRTFTTATLSAPADQYSAATSIGRFAIIITGNKANVFDSNGQTWSTHTLSQSGLFSISKTQRYTFFVAKGTAEVFDTNSQTWSTLTIQESPAAYCPSTAVGDYVFFAVDRFIHIYDSTTSQFIRTMEFKSESSFGDVVFLEAGAVGQTATFMTSDSPKAYIKTFDISAGIRLTPQVVSPVQVPATLSTHQLAKATSQYTVAGNNVVFMNDENIAVEIYNSQTNSWTTSTPTVNTRGALLATSNSYIVFADTANESLLNVLSVASNTWTIVTKNESASELWLAVGDYLFFAERTSYYPGGSTYLRGPIAYSLKDDTWTSLHWNGYSTYYLSSVRYRDYAVFADSSSRYFTTEAYNTADNLSYTIFGYGGESRISPGISTPGDYLVIAGGVLDNGYSDDYAIYNPYTGFVMSGKMPTPHRSVRTINIEPVMMFIDSNRIEYLNMETGEWTMGLLEVSLDNAIVSGHKLFASNGARDYLGAFDSRTDLWYNITFNPSTPVGQFFRFGDFGAFLNSNSVVLYNPSNDKWTQSTFSGKQFKDALYVGNRVVFVSSDDKTIDTISLATLTTTPTTPNPSPSTPVSWTPTTTQEPTATVPTTQTQPWSPWMYTPTTTTHPAPTSSPVAYSTPISNSPSTTTSPSSQVPSSIQVPVSSNTPVTSSNQPGTTTTPAVSVVPLNSDNNVQVSSASLLAVVQSLAVWVLAILLL